MFQSERMKNKKIKTERRNRKWLERPLAIPKKRPKLKNESQRGSMVRSLTPVQNSPVP